MASTKEPRHALASYEWIKEERDQASHETAKHVEDFSYSVTHELEWLNEKMAEVFSADAKTLTDIFKTPGRLRNKTPRTVKKLTAPSPRVPLGDIFAPNARPSPSANQNISVIDHAPAFRAGQGIENQEPGSKPISRSKSPQRVGKPGNTDSGYHGMTEDETDNERNSHLPQVATLPQTKAEVPAAEDSAQSGEDSFTSAPENLDARKAAREPEMNSIAAAMMAPPPHQAAHGLLAQASADDDMFEDTPMSDAEQSEEVSNRKSSFSFSSLPAREPLLGKRSLGARQSHFDGASQTSLGSKPGQKVTAVSRTEGEAMPHMSGELAKSTTQLLHERITLLGQARNAQTSKNSAQGVLYPELPPEAQSTAAAAAQAQSDKQPRLLVPMPTSAGPELSRPQSAYQDQTTRPLSTMSLNVAPEEKTPIGSPSNKKQYDGPLSASKNRLMSVLKSARSIFASSASASAAAKLEAHTTTPARDLFHESKNESLMNVSGALQSDVSLVRSISRPISIVSMSPSKETRSSNESERKREKEVQAQRKAEAELEKAREKERIKVVKEQEEKAKAEMAEAARLEKAVQKAAAARREEEEEAAAAAAPRSALPLVGKLRSVTRPVRPMTAAKDRPAPVNVKTASQIQHGLNDASQQPRPTSSIRPSSAQSTIKVSTLQSTKSGVRALEAAARKKELEEKEKLRRQRQKKELELKRIAARAEEERDVAEAQRIAQETKLAVLKQAEKVADVKRRELQKLEQQRQQEETERAKAAHELADAIARERAQQQAQLRTDVTGTIRKLGQKSAIDNSRPPIQPNPAKPAKRHLNADGEETTQARSGPAYQQNESKRRKTEEDEETGTRTSVMAPPKRPSTMRKETLSRFPTGYAQAPVITHPPATLFKTAVSSQLHAQHVRPAPTHPSQTVQMSTGRIPFAESSKPSVAMPTGHPGGEHAGKFKTPVRPVQGATRSAAKSSPMYANGDLITLPEIATDSEDEDDDEDEDTGFRAPSWVASPALRELLTQQQLVDPESVFGPIAELRMEEVFKNAKNPERLKKFRDRGSSAAWVQNGDAVTSAEKRRDMELRERVAREGGWRYEPGL